MINVFKDGAILAMIGDLRQADFRNIPGVSFTEPPTHPPSSAAVRIPLVGNNKTLVAHSLLPRIGLRKRVWNVEIIVEDAVVFAAYDGFDADCVWVIASVGETFVQGLIAERHIWSFMKVD